MKMIESVSNLAYTVVDWINDFLEIFRVFRIKFRKGLLWKNLQFVAERP